MKKPSLLTEGDDDDDSTHSTPAESAYGSTHADATAESTHDVGTPTESPADNSTEDSHDDGAVLRELLYLDKEAQQQRQISKDTMAKSKTKIIEEKEKKLKQAAVKAAQEDYNTKIATATKIADRLKSGEKRQGHKQKQLNRTKPITTSRPVMLNPLSDNMF